MQKKLMPSCAIRATIIAILLAIAVPTIANAEETAHGAHDGGHVWHKHYMAGFIGAADEGRDDGLALALEYERRLNERWGVGAVLEHTFGDLDA